MWSIRYSDDIVLPYRSLANLKSTWRDWVSILRTEGVLSFIRAGFRQFNLNHRGFYYYLNYIYKRWMSRSYRTADPFTVFQINPQQIDRLALGDIDRWKHIGEVRSGDWDRSESTLEERAKYRSVVDRFENGTPWEETDIYLNALKRIESGGAHWNGCRTVDDIDRRVAQIESLYEEIKQSGFKPQSTLQGRSVKSTLLSGSFDRSKTDITVAIDREGQYLFVDGHHRLAIAHVLGTDEVPVRVVVRHERWQNLREDAMEIKSESDLPNQIKEYVDHPDISIEFDE